MNEFSQMEKARELLAIEECDEIYFTCLFVALRATEIEIKEAVTIINKELQKTPHIIDYKHIYIEDIEQEDLLDEGFLMDEGYISLADPALLLAAEEDLKERKLQNKLFKPKGNLGNMIWLEAALRRCNTVKQFATNLVNIKKEIVTMDGVITRTTIDKIL